MPKEIRIKTISLSENPSNYANISVAEIQRQIFRAAPPAQWTAAARPPLSVLIHSRRCTSHALQQIDDTIGVTSKQVTGLKVKGSLSSEEDLTAT